MDGVSLFLDVAWQALNGLAPAAALAVLLALISTLKKPIRPLMRSAGWRLILNFLAGAVVMVGGWFVFGHDGMMATYAVLVAVMGTSQRLLTGGWR